MSERNLEKVRHAITSRLPAEVRWVVDQTSLVYNFSRARKPLRPIQSNEILCRIEKKWLDLYLFGEEDFAEGGGARQFVGVDEKSGRILGLDVERDRAQLYLLNSDIECFIGTFLVFDEALRRKTIPLRRVASAAYEIDPVAFRRSDWRLLANHLLTY